MPYENLPRDTRAQKTDIFFLNKCLLNEEESDHFPLLETFHFAECKNSDPVLRGRGLSGMFEKGLFIISLAKLRNALQCV